MPGAKYHTDRLTLLRTLLAGIFMLVLYYGWSQLLPHQLAGSKLFHISIDNTFWLFHYSGIPQWLNGQPFAVYILEIVFVLIGIALFRTGNPVFNAIFLGLFILLSLFVQTWSCILTKISVIIPIVLFPFCFKGALFRFTWKFPKYYLIYLMVSAGLFKIINGGLFHPGQMENILFNQHIDLMMSDSGHWSLQIAELLGNSKFLSIAGYWLITLAELSFIILFFTNYCNRFFSIILVIFCTVIWLTMRIYTFEMLFLLLPLIQISAGND